MSHAQGFQALSSSSKLFTKTKHSWSLAAKTAILRRQVETRLSSGRPSLSDAAVTAWPKGADPPCDHNPGLSEGRQDGPVAERVCSRVSLPVPALPSPTTAGLSRELGRHFLGGPPSPRL